jgi:SpoVK/Ycf46/Vps4 family AAA+-type ATPase
MTYEKLRRRLHRILAEYPEAGKISTEDLEEIVEQMSDFTCELTEMVDASASEFIEGGEDEDEEDDPDD